MRTEYDLLVIGGGPGGAIAAKTAAERGLSTCLIEKRPAIGSPVRCAEGIGRSALSEFIDPDPRWISAEVSQAALVSPDQTMMTLDSSAVESKVGYVLERKIFDRVLVEEAAAAGADILVKTGAKSPEITDGRITGAFTDGDVSRIHADLVIAADGVESQFSRICGVDTRVRPCDMMSCAQYLLTGIDLNPGMNVFYLGNAVAPGGYLWVFPKGERSANVGVGIQGSRSGDGHRAKDYLDSFIRKMYPRGKTLECIAGGVPVCEPLSSTVLDGLIIVGDAARVVDPITGGGIYHAMYTGRLAGETAARCIPEGEVSSTALSAYDKAWRESQVGKSLHLHYAFRKYFMSLSDEKMDALAHSAKRLDLAEFSIMNLVKELARNNPGLLWDLRKVLPGIFPSL